MALTIVLEGQANLGVTTGVPATITIQLGTPGPSATVTVGTTTTGTPGSDASVVNVGTTSNAILDFTIPRGDQGVQGVQGVQGIQGAKGDTGSAGASATVTAGTTTTGAPGSSASVTNVGSTSAAVFNFTIPRGNTGATGATGSRGAAATVSVGTTTTGAPGSSAAVSNSGSTTAAVFNFTIPAGVGVPTGGTTGQALVKSSNANYATTWQSINSAAWGNITGTLSNQTDLNSALNDKLSLAGGTMEQNAAINFGTDNNPVINIGSFTGDNIEAIHISANNEDDVNSNLIISSDGISLSEKYTNLSLSASQGIVFNDATQQNTAGIPAIGGTATGQINIEYDNSKTESTSSYVYTHQTNTGTNPLAYGVVYTGGFEAGNSAGQWIEFTPSQLRFGDGSIQTTAATGGGGDYLPLAGGTMTGNIVFDGTSGQYIGKGTFDTSRGGNYGLSLVCSIGYELNWQAGWLTTTNQSSTTPRSLYLDSLAGTTLKAWDSSNDTGIDISHTAITFADSTVQSTAALPLTGGTMTGSIVLTDSSEYKLQGSGNDGGDNSWIFSLGNNMTDFTPELLLSINTTDHGNQHVKTQYNKVEVYYEDTDSGASNTGTLNSAALTFTDNSASTTAIYSVTGITFPDSTVQTTAAQFYNMSAGPSGLSQSGNIAHHDYPEEIELTIDGTTYRVPARIV